MPPKRAKKDVFPTVLPRGELLKDDVTHSVFEIQKKIGQGGFGFIYTAVLKEKTKYFPAEVSDTQFVVKSGRETGSQLFPEIAAFREFGKPSKIVEYMKQKKLKSIGIPFYIGSGRHVYEDEEQLFLVMPHLGDSLFQMFTRSSRLLKPKTAMTIARQMIDILEYIHSKDMTHCDLKSGNILLGLQDPNQVYLVDFGLVNRFRGQDGKHRPNVTDKKRKHDGTTEYASVDSHEGRVPSRRSDLESLAYCLLEWLTGSLPWLDKREDKEAVATMKKNYMTRLDQLMTDCVVTAKSHPAMVVKKYLEVVTALEYDEEPNYAALKKLFTDAMKSLKIKDDGVLEFSGASHDRNGLGASPALDVNPAKKAVVKATKAKRDLSADEATMPKRKKPAAKVEFDSPPEEVKKAVPRKKKTTKLVEFDSSASEQSEAEPEPVKPPAKQRKAPTKKRTANHLDEESKEGNGSIDVVLSPPKRGKRSTPKGNDSLNKSDLAQPKRAAAKTSATKKKDKESAAAATAFRPIDANRVKDLSDSELRLALKSHGYVCGGVGPSTREFYERKLVQLIGNSDLMPVKEEEPSVASDLNGSVLSDDISFAAPDIAARTVNRQRTRKLMVQVSSQAVQTDDAPVELPKRKKTAKKQ